MKHISLILLFALMLLVFNAPSRAQRPSSTDTVTVHTMRGTFYADKFVGRKTSSGEVFTQQKYTAAHHSYKFGTLLLVTNPANGKQVIVKVNDRCPRSNVVDMTRKAAKQIGVSSKMVKVQVLPQRFVTYWENQDRIVKILENGEFWDYVQNPAQYLDATVDNLNVTPPKNTPTDTGSTHTSSSRNSSVQLYNVELFRCKSLTEAKRLVLQLPIYYQDRVSYKNDVASGSIVAVIETAVRKDKAESICKELGGLFPAARVVENK